MVPLTTVQGLATDELKARVGGRALYIWGTGDIGLDVLVSLRRAGIEPGGFLHTAPQGNGSSAHGLPVSAAADVLARGAKVFVVVASTAHRRAAEAACRDAGLRADTDFLNYLAIARPAAVIEIARRQDGVTTSMSAAIFARVLDKVAADQPRLCHVELSWLGDPMLNPELAQIVACCESVVPCTVSTRLADVDRLEAVVAAQPSRFNVLVRGCAQTWDDRAAGIDWPHFLDNLERLKSLARRQGGRTRFLLRHEQTRGEANDVAQGWRRLLADSGIALSMETPYITPYDDLLHRCEGATPAEEVEARQRGLTWNLERALELCRRDRDNPCLSQRVFPIIGASLETGLCHLYERPRLAHDYLAASWTDLLLSRRRTPHCERCQAQGLHRLDLAVLAQRYPAVAPSLFDP